MFTIKYDRLFEVFCQPKIRRVDLSFMADGTRRNEIFFRRYYIIIDI